MLIVVLQNSRVKATYIGIIEEIVKQLLKIKLHIKLLNVEKR